MQRFLIDAHQPRVPSVWAPPNCVFIADLANENGVGWTDTRIWNHALEHGFTIVSKDSDFTYRVLVSRKAPHVVNIRLGNMRLTELCQFIEGRWLRIAKLSADFRLVDLYRNRLERRR